LGHQAVAVDGNVLVPAIAHETPDSVVAIVPFFCGICGGADVPELLVEAPARVVDIVPVRDAAGVKLAVIAGETSPSLEIIEPETLGGCVCVPAIEAVASPVVARSRPTTTPESRNRIGIGHCSP
jgi:hypothetical protein